MKRHLLLTATLISSFVGFSQITITSTNMPVSGDTLRVTNVQLNTVGDYTTTGANYTWNFDSVKASGQSVREFKSPAAAGYIFGISPSAYGEKFQDSLSIPIPGMAVTMKDLTNFYKKNGTTSFNTESFGFKYSGFGIPNNYTDKDELYFFPLDYMDRDSSTFYMSTITSTAMPFAYKKHGYRITEADGWGTISTPYGDAQCLRVVTTQYSTDSIKMVIPIQTFTIPINLGFPNYVRSIQWLSLTERIPFFEVSGTVTKFGNTETFTPNAARYRDIPRTFVGIKEIDEQVTLGIYPNPTSNELNIVILQDKKFRLEIYNSAGQKVIDKELSNSGYVNKHTIDVSALSEGVYVGTIGDGKTIQNFKFNKQ